MTEYMAHETAFRIDVIADLCIRKGFFSVSFFAVIHWLKSHVDAVIRKPFPCFLLTFSYKRNSCLFDKLHLIK